MYEDPLVYGKSQIPNIVSLHPQWGNERATMRVYTREGDNVIYDDYDWYPYAWVSDLSITRGLDEITMHSLKGDLHFNWLAYVDNYDDWKTLKSRINMANEKRANSGFYVSNLPQQWMMGTGNTLFKGMQFNDIVRMQLDIETYGENHFARAENEDDPITIIVASDNRGRKIILHWKPGFEHIPHSRYCVNEEHMLNELVDLIHTWDPDVIELHNGFNYDWPYIRTRAEMYGIKLRIGRDNSEPWGYKSTFRAGENNKDFEATIINGRHVVDTMFACMRYNVFKRDLPNNKLKDVAKYFGFAAEDRTYIPGDKIWWYWDNDPEPLLKYALEDVDETGAIAEQLMGSEFYTSQLIPMSYENIARQGSGAKIESLFLREYLRQRHSIPKPQSGQQNHGGHTRMHVQGIKERVVYADVESLYPSIMLYIENCIPKSDHLGIFKDLLQALTDLRFRWKNNMKKAKNPELRRKWEGQQAAAKVLINSFYGTMGYKYSHWNDFEAADNVALNGQDIVKRMVSYVEDKGGEVIEVDTDGVIFVPPPDIEGEEAEIKFVKGMTHAMPKGIKIGFDGRFQKVLSYRAKNYMLENYPSEEDLKEGRTHGGRKTKGGAFKSSGLEPYNKTFLETGFHAILDGGIEKLSELYHYYRNRIMKREMTIEELMATKSLTKTFEQYHSDISTNSRCNPLPQYEVAEMIIRKTGEDLGKGDRVSYYISGTAQDNKTKAAYDMAKPITDFDPSDYNVAYYLERLNKTTERFRPLFIGNDFANIFMSQPSLFEVDYSDIQPVTKTVG